MALFGDTLRQARAQRGLTLREAEASLRINRHYLAALEDEQFDDLPPLIYQRGIVRSYAGFLSLDQAKLVELFEEARGHRPDDPPTISPLEEIDMPSHWAPNFAIIAFTLIAGAVVFAWMYSAYFSTTAVPATPAELLPTVTPVSRDVIYVPSPTPSLPSPTPTQPPTAVPTPSPTSIAVPTQEPVATSAIEQNSAVVEPTAETSAAEQTSPTALPANVAGIRITALSDIYVQVVADDVLFFEGGLAAGESTDFVTGSTFTVYTTSGANTQFTNDRGEVFLMGNESGEAVYQLAASQP